MSIKMYAVAQLDPNGSGTIVTSFVQQSPPVVGAHDSVKFWQDSGYTVFEMLAEEVRR